MSVPSFDPVQSWRDVVKRNVELLQRIAHKILWPGERYDFYLDADGLGVWVAVTSTARPEALLKAVEREAFPTFGFLGMMFDGQNYWTHFRAL
jgi:hypothetical protein